MRKQVERLVEFVEGAGEYRVTCPYDEEVNEILRGAGGRWDEDLAAWRLNANHVRANEAIRLLERDHDFTLE